MNPYAILIAAALTGGTAGAALAQVPWLPEILLALVGAAGAVLWVLYEMDQRNA